MRQLIVLLLVFSLLTACSSTMPEAIYNDGTPIPEEELQRFERNKSRTSYMIAYAAFGAAIGGLAHIGVNSGKDENENTDNTVGPAVGGAGVVIGVFLGHSKGKKKDREVAIDVAREYQNLQKEEKEAVDKLKRETEKLKQKAKKKKNDKKPPL